MDPFDAIVRGLTDADVGRVAYVPCGRIRQLFPRLERALPTLGVTREEEAVGVLAGSAMAGTRSALVTQSSGLGNAMNALTTLTEAYRIPLTLIVSHRGDPDDWNPAQVPQGRRIRAWLKTLDVPVREPGPGEIRPAVRRAVERAWTEERTTAVLLRREVLPETEEGRR